MVQNKKQTSNKPKFAEVVLGDKDTKEMYEASNPRPRRNPYLKLSYPNGVTLTYGKNNVNDMFEERQNTGKSASLAEKYANVLGQLSEESDNCPGRACLGGGDRVCHFPHPR